MRQERDGSRTSTDWLMSIATALAGAFGIIVLGLCAAPQVGALVTGDREPAVVVTVMALWLAALILSAKAAASLMQPTGHSAANADEATRHGLD